MSEWSFNIHGTWVPYGPPYHPPAFPPYQPYYPVPNPPTPPIPQKLGWTCPTCGRSYAPWFKGPCEHDHKVETENSTTIHGLWKDDEGESFYTFGGGDEEE
jgi:hypothetical protein